MNTDAIASLCDALEWLLVAWGHRHTGKVRVSYAPIAAAQVFTNKSTVDGGLWTLDRPEAELRVEVHPDGRAMHTIGGSPEWVLGDAGHCADRLCDAIAQHGWAVQAVDGGGVVVARCDRG